MILRSILFLLLSPIINLFYRKKNYKKHIKIKYFNFRDTKNTLSFNFLIKFQIYFNTLFYFCNMNFNNYIYKLLNISFKKRLFILYYFNDSFVFIKSLFIIFIIDALFDGDEPIFEPLEWSLIQTWLVFIFIFAWIGENLIVARFGSFTGRDKRVWYAWYKALWIIELFYIITLGVAILFIIVPFYFELTYANSFIMTFWNWFSKVFFFKFLCFYFILLLISLQIQLNIKWLYYKKLLFLVFIIIIGLTFLLLTQFYITFFSYFTDPIWYIKNRHNDFIQLSHEPWKWGWDLETRDHFQYHISKTIFWFKTDGPFAEAFFLINLFCFFSLFGVWLFWVVLFRRIYSLNEVSYIYTVSAISSLRQFFFLFLLLYLLILSSIVIIYLKFPYEFLWLLNYDSLLKHFFFNNVIC